MNNTQIIQQLEGLKWTKQEASLYVTLLQLGPQPASIVASHLGKNRITVYHALERLAQKKIIETNMGKNVVYYSARSPSLLLQQMSEQKNRALQDFENEIENLNWLMPHLEKLEVQDFIRPQVQLFHGIDALKSIYQLSLEAKSMLAYFQPWPVKHGAMLNIIDDWHTQERVKLKIPIKILIPGTTEGIRYAAIKKDLKETKIVPKSVFPFQDVTIIADNRMLVFSLSEQLGIAIKSQYIANNQRAIFNLAWVAAKFVTDFDGQE